MRAGGFLSSPSTDPDDSDPMDDPAFFSRAVFVCWLGPFDLQHTKENPPAVLRPPSSVLGAGGI
jgi:hypothetical protein